MAHIIAISRTFPPHSYPQDEFTSELTSLFPAGTFDPAKISTIHRNCRVNHRYAGLPLTEVATTMRNFTATNNAYIRIGLDLIERSVRDALQKANVRADEVDNIFFVSITGIANPSLESRLLNRFWTYNPSTALGPDVGSFRADVTRTPIFGVGCVGGGTIINRASDYLAGAPNGIALAIALELCTLTIQYDDIRMANQVATGLFGDGCATMVMLGEHAHQKRKAAAAAAAANRLDLSSSALSRLTERSDGSVSEFSCPPESSSASTADDSDLDGVSSPPTSVGTPPGLDDLAAGVAAAQPKPSLLPKVVSTRALFYPDSERLIAWEIGSQGFTIILSNEVAKIIRPNLLKDATAFLLDARAKAEATNSKTTLPTSVDEIASFVVHPGGPKVLHTVAECLNVKAPQAELSLSETEQSLRGLEVAWKSLEDVGNCSSVSVLMIMEDTINTTIKAPKIAPKQVETVAPAGTNDLAPPVRRQTLDLKEGDYSMCIAFGPGFAIELSLLEWHAA